MSPFLEVDEAQFVGQVDWRLLYENSHPPLYNWLLRLLLEVTGWNWPLSTATLKFGLLAAFYWLTWDSARRLGNNKAGLLAIAAVAFLPQIVWQFAHTAAHSIMLLAGTVAVIHAAILICQSPRLLNYIWLGMALTLGAMAKFNFYLFAIPFLVALAWDSSLRRRLYFPNILISFAIFLAAMLPFFLALIEKISANTDRMAKLYRGSKFEWIDIPFVGIDGFVSLLLGLLATSAPLLLVWWFARRDETLKRNEQAWEQHFSKALGHALMAAAGLFALIVIIGDMHHVHERYLVPVFAGLPIWLAVTYPIERARKHVVIVACFLFCAALLGYIAMVQTTKHRYAMPYKAVAEEILKTEQRPRLILSPKQGDAENLTIALGWPGATSPKRTAQEEGALLLWRGTGAPPTRKVPAGMELIGERKTLKAPFTNAREGTMTFSVQKIDPK